MDNNNMFEQEQSNEVRTPVQGGNYEQPAYQQPAYQPELEEPMSMGEWLITYLIQLIPCAGLIMMFVWAFSKSEKKSKSNYFKATLIWYAIWSVISIFLWIFIGAAIVAGVSAMGY